jgi:hypothetical protein
MDREREPDTTETTGDSRQAPPESALPPELQGILCDLQSPDATTRARAVRALCPCRGVQWGVPIFRYVREMRRDPNPIVRRAVLHDLKENPWWSERQETRPDLGPQPRTVKVTLAVKGMALGDLCDRLRADTGVPLVADRSVADDKVTLFCRHMPLRDVMGQLSQTLGYIWVQSRRQGAYRYELIRDPHSPRPEELRRRDREEALLALEREMERYRPYLSLSPEEVRERAETTLAEEKLLLEKLAGSAWAPIRIYFRLSAEEREALRSGRTLEFAEGRATVLLTIHSGDLGELTLQGASRDHSQGGDSGSVLLAVGASPAALSPDNARLNAKFAHDRALRARVTLGPGGRRETVDDSGALPTSFPPDFLERVTSAEVLEAVHQATGMPIVADFYTRLYPAEAVSPRDQPLFAALNQIADAMGLRWHKGAATREVGGWLQFRSTRFHHDRLHEVPNRLLARWAESRRRHGSLTPDDRVEIAQAGARSEGADSLGECRA